MYTFMQIIELIIPNSRMLSKLNAGTYLNGEGRVPDEGSTLRTRSEFPIFPFHFDLPICKTNHLDYDT